MYGHHIRWEMGHGGSPAGESIHVVNILGLQDARIGLNRAHPCAYLAVSILGLYLAMYVSI